jgi:hypothetical protein
MWGDSGVNVLAPTVCIDSQLSMGLFDFFKSDVVPYSDKVWMTKDAALKGLMTEALHALTQARIPVVLSYFSDKQQEVLDFALLKNIPHVLVDANSMIPQDTSVLLMDAQTVNASAQALHFLVQQSKTAPVSLLFYGHYPIPEKENELLKKISLALDVKNEIRFFSSLDDRAFEIFGADNLKSILEKLGLKEDEAIEHAMVTRSMVRAREKIAAAVPHESVTSTESGWYQKNYAK